MALVLFGGGISDMRGSVAGNVFSKNRYGSYVRNRTKPVNPNSPRQQKVRNIMGQIVSAWSQIVTLAQRNAWEVYAAAVNFTNALGQTIQLTGYNHYIRSNMARINNGFTRIDAAPTILLLPPTDGSFACAASEGSQLVTITFDDTADWANQNSGFMSIHQGLPKNSAVAFYGNHFRTLGTLLGNSGAGLTSPQTIAMDFPAAENQKDWFFGRIGEEDGRLSEKFRDSCIVTS